MDKSSCDDRRARKWADFAKAAVPGDKGRYQGLTLNIRHEQKDLHKP